jgi:tartrate/fumarate subfamily iron-sulfur-dependent hydro-lyase beta chain
MLELTLPSTTSALGRLRAGDLIFLNGTIFTARDLAHKRAVEDGLEGLPTGFRGGAIFHCGPIMRKLGNGWQTISAGPTTSTRMEEMLPRFIKAVEPSMIVGKGGVSGEAVSALVDAGCPYLSMTGGTAALASSSVRSARGPFWDDLGSAEAVWELDVRRFGPLVVAIDSVGKNLHEEVLSKARSRAVAMFPK